MSARAVRKIIVHCSDSPWGDAAVIDRWHKKRGWKGNGYHRIILNGRRTRWAYHKDDDGVVETGRPLDDDHILDTHEVGAHVRGHNRDSVGVCLIGKRGLYTVPQQLSLRITVRDLMDQFCLTIDDVYGHRDFSLEKTCPDIATADLRDLIALETPVLRRIH